MRVYLQKLSAFVLLLTFAAIGTISAQTYNVSGNSGTVTTCSGTLYDHGNTGDYGTSRNDYITICSGTTQSVVISFTQFSTESGYDYVYIYDGNSTTSPQLAQLSGNPALTSYTSSSTCITLRFTSDGSVQGAGFQANISCIANNTYNINTYNGQTVNLCSGRFVDAGGAGSNYSNNQDMTVTFCSDNGQHIQVDFTAYNTENGYDYLYVYDGPTTGSPLKFQLNGNLGGAGVPIIISSGTCLTFRFVSDGATVAAGWDANITCTNSATTVASDFCGAPTPICDINGYTGITSGAYDPDAPGNLITTLDNAGCGGISIENNSWLSFVASATTANFTFNSYGCSSSSSGIQMAILSTSNCNTFTAVSNCVNQSSGPGSGTINATGLTIGQTYYIMIDGYAGNICTYSVTANSGVQVPNISSSTGTTICLGQSTTLTANATGATGYSWSSNPSGLSSTSQTVNVTPSATTSYTVIASGACGSSATTTTTIIVRPTPTVTIAPSPAQVCSGSSVALTATGTAYGNAANQTFSNTTDYNIPDGNATGVSSPITVSGIYPTTVAANAIVSVCLNITHTYDGELDIFLVCPGGTQIQLSTDNGGSSNNYTNTCFYATGTAITSGTAPFTGNFTPEQAFTLLNACNVNGTWNLKVVDQAGGDVGAINDWSITFNNQPAISTYAWSPSGTLSSSNTAATTASPTSNTTYTVTVTDGLGCTGTNSVAVTVNAKPTAAITPNPASACAGSPITLNGNPSGGTAPYTHGWTGDIGPLSATNVVNPSFNTLTAGTYNLTYTVTDSKGCTGTATRSVVVRSKPTASVTPNPAGACAGVAISMNGNPTGGTSPYTHAWTGTGSGFLSTTASATPTFTHNSAGTYSLTYTVTDTYGCTGTSSTVVTVTGKPTTSITPLSGSVCAGTTVNLNGNPTGGSGTYTTHSWTGAAAPPLSSTSVPAPTFSTTTTGTYNLTYTVTDNNGCSGSSSTSIVVQSKPTASITPNPASVCEGVALPMNGNGSGGTGVLTHSWTGTGSGSLSSTTSATPNFTNNSAGTYTLTYTVTDANSCSGTSSVSVVVNDKPSAAVSPDPANVCAGVTINMNGNPSGGSGIFSSHVWTGSNTTPLSSTTSQTPTFNSSSSGTYTFTYTVTDNKGCTGSDNIQVVVAPKPTVSVTPNPGAVCAGTSLNLSGGAAGGTAPYTVHAWTGSNTGPLSSTSVANPVFNTSSAGTYTLTYTVTDNSTCTGSGSTTIVVNAKPTVSITPNPANICSGSSINLNGNPSGGSGTYTTHGWTGATSYLDFTNISTPIFTSSTAGTYNLTYTVTDNNSCTGSASTSVVVSNKPAVNITPSPASVCAGVNLQLNGNPSGGTTVYSNHLWTGATSTLSSTSIPNPVFNTSVAGTYNLNYTVTDNGACSESGSIAVVVTSKPTATITPNPAAICAGSSIALNGGPAGGSGVYTSHVWTGNTSPLTSTTVYNPTFTTSTAGTYNLTYTVTDNLGCTGSSNIAVTVNANPTATINPNPATMCAGATITLTATPGGGSSTYTAHLWTGDTGPLSSTSVTAPTFSTSTTGTYNLTYTVTDNKSCTGSASVQVVVNGNPTASITPDPAEICAGGSTVLNGNPAGGSGTYTHNWTGNTVPLGGSTTIAAPNFSTSITGTYNLTYTVTDNNLCTGSDAIAVVVNPNPTASISPDPAVMCAGGTLNLNGSPSGGTPAFTHVWTGSTVPLSATNIANPAFSTASSGNYSLTYTVTDSKSCSASDNITVTVNSNPTASITPDPAEVCAGESLSLNGGAAGGSGTYVNTIWTGSTSQLSSTTTTLTDFSTATVGTYSLTFSVTDNNSCSGSDDIVVTVNENPTATLATSDENCGSSDGTATASPADGTPGYTYQWPVTAGSQTSATATGLTAGVFVVTVTDSKGCTVTAQDTVKSASGLGAKTTIEDVLCNGGSDGAADVTPIGGVAPYTFLWGPSAGNQTTQYVSGLAAGTYDVTVTDDVSCIYIVLVTIGEPPAILAPTNTTMVSCNGLADGVAVVTPSGGIPGYTYVWDASTASQTDSLATGLSGGTFTVTVTDANNCTVTANTTVDESAVLTSVVSSAQVSCNGAGDGQATVTPSGGTTLYAFQWDAAAGAQTDSTATGLAGGTYAVTVTDANGCTDVQSVTISESGTLTLATSATDITCNGAGDGIGVGTPSGGTLPYTYQWDINAGSQTDSTATGLIGGTYTLTVSDSQGCSATGSVTITDPVVLTVTTSETNVDCNLAANGAVSATPAGGVIPYTYQWDASTGNQTNTTATGLSGGTYTLTVTDVNGCTATASATVAEPTDLAASKDSSNAACNGATDGWAVVTPSGGTVPYTYQWDIAAASQTDSTATGLGSGAYVVTITDANGCDEVVAFAIGEASGMSSTTASTDAQCNGATDGTAAVTVSGGTPPYSYLWDVTAGSQTDSLATGLATGTYGVTVTDANGCNLLASVNVSQPGNLTLTPDSTIETCPGTLDGTAWVSISGGTAPYTYLWDAGAGSQTDTLATGLAAGTYTITVTDANACAQTSAISVPGNSNPTVALTPDPAEVCAAQSIALDGNAAGGSGTFAAHIWIGDSAFLDDPTIPTPIFSASASGTYHLTYTATDSNGCFAEDSLSIVVNENPVVTTSATDENCGQSDATADAAPSLGTAPYTFAWDAMAGGQATQVATGLAAGTYGVTVTDDNGCFATGSIVVNSTSGMTGSTSSLDADCNGSSTGEATVTVSGGNTPYSYAWDVNAGNQVVATATGLSAGTYYVTVSDNALCTYVDSVIVVEPSALNAATSSTDVLCNGDSTGTASTHPFGGTLPYTFTWDGMASAQTDSTATGLSAGVYGVTVTDANNCTTISSVQVNQPFALSLSLDSTAALCAGDSSGTLTANVSGGVSGYSYAWSTGIPGDTTATVGGLSAGVYSVTATDLNGCFVTGIASIGEPTAVSVSASATDALCADSASGSATVSTLGGTFPYAYQWGVSSGNQTNPTATGLSAGMHYVTVTDLNGCTDSTSVAVNEPAPVAVAMGTNDLNCNGDGSGIIWASTSGGSIPYSYLWSSFAAGQVTDTVSGLPAGVYQVTVTDNNGCLTIASDTLVEPSVFTAPMSAVSALCSSGGGGEASVLPTGGTAPYAVVWEDGSNTDTITGLTTGMYSMTATDANGCTVTDSIQVNEPPVLQVSTTDVNVGCYGDSTGYVTAVVTGGVSPYSYGWSANTGSQVSIAAVGLPAGVYSLTVTDANGCTVSASDTVSQPQPLTSIMTATTASCGNPDGSAIVQSFGGILPHTYYWTNAVTTAANTGLIPATYVVTITDLNGCTLLDTAIVVGVTNNLAVVANGSDVLCNGGSDGTATAVATGGVQPITFLWSNSQTTSSINGLTAGSYSIVVMDSLGCTDTTTVIVNQPGQLVATVITADEYCNQDNGSAVAQVAGGVAAYTYAWSHSVTAQNDTATGISSGAVTVTVTDANGCSATATGTVGFIDDSYADFSPDVTEGFMPLVVNFSNNSTSGTYQWNFGDSVGTSTDINPTYGYDAYGEFVVILTATSINGCVATDSALIDVWGLSEIIIPNVFSPNNDGINDYFLITAKFVESFNARIYNRWGGLIFEWSHPQSGWDGRDMSGMKAPVGTYYYTVKAKGNDDVEYDLSGYFMLVK